MSRFISNVTKKLDLGDGEWVEFKAGMSFNKMKEFTSSADQGDGANNIELLIPLLEYGIVNWLIKDDEGKEVPYSKEQILELDSKTILELAGFATTLYMPKNEKKSSEQLEG